MGWLYLQCVIPHEELRANFFTSGIYISYLFVKYTWQEKGKECVKLRHYKTINVNDISVHTEEQFLQDVKNNTVFPKDSKFELYSNFTPCNMRTDGKDPCCKLLLDAFLKDKILEPSTVKIYGVFKYRYKGIDPTPMLKKLVGENCKCSIEFLSETKLNELIPLLPTTEHKDACLDAFKAVKLKKGEVQRREKDFENINSQ